MKGIIYLTVIVMIFSCTIRERDRDEGPQPSTKYKPVLMDRSTLEKSIAFLPSRTLKNTGKIYIKDDYLFIVENYRGVHIINNTKPSSPVAEGFISVPGCIDVAIKNEVMYVDNATDLVAINIAALPRIKITERVKKIFPELIPPDVMVLPTELNAQNRPEGTVIVEWIETQNN